MKVSEAKTKVCPFMTNGSETSGFINEVLCQCGDCMAWEYIKTHDKYDTDGLSVMDCDNLLSDGWKDNKKDQYFRKELSDDFKEGYCKRIDK